MSLAYERAAGAIESSCVHEHPEGDDDLTGWYDLDSSDVDLEMEIGYLESRWLLLHHPDNPRLVAICDEGESCEPKVTA